MIYDPPNIKMAINWYFENMLTEETSLLVWCFADRIKFGDARGEWWL